MRHMDVALRPALAADELVSTKFRNNKTRGFAASEALDRPVWVQPGTELAFAARPRYRAGFWIRKAPGRVARFRQIDRESHHGALEFSDGTIVRVASLLPGQRAKILQRGPQIA